MSEIGMSLSLLQGYSSAEEDDNDAGEAEQHQSDFDRSDEEDGEENDVVSQNRYKPLLEPNPSSSSSLPSALDAFSEVLGPPEFLNNSVEEASKEVDNQRWRHGLRKNNRDKKGFPSGAVVEAKPQLVGIHERVRSDVEGSIPITSSGQKNISSATAQEGKPASAVNNSNGDEAAERLRMCSTCGVPKTYSHSKGIVCPICGDRPAADSEAAKRKGSAIKDKEKSKRMKGQSSHATWKSETEMVLRQQFD